MNKKAIFTVILKVIVYVCTVIAAACGISLVNSSCSAYKSVEAKGTTRIVSVDTTRVVHGAGFNVQYHK